MWASIKRFFTTHTQSKPTKRDSLEVAFLQQSKAMTDLMKQQQALIAQQQGTLDRIVTARYDRPYTPAQKLPSDSLSPWALNDQGDVRPDEIEAGLSNLGVDSDEEFLKAVGAQ